MENRVFSKIVDSDTPVTSSDEAELIARIDHARDVKSRRSSY